MKFRNTAPYFSFTNQQRKGIFFLLIIIIALQLFYFFSDFSQAEKSQPEKEQWLSLQSEVDSLKAIKYNEKPKIYPFNPNFISDYKGYKLGMSVQEIDRLFAYRKENKYVNSAEEFQKVTKVSDSLLNVISPYFKFPNWIQNKKNFKAYDKGYLSQPFKKEDIIVLDINQAVKEDFMKINGIGEGLSQRILKQKESLEAFVSMEQINDVWGLPPEVILELKKYFKVSSFPKIKKIPVNDASLKELSQFPYFKYTLAKQIVTYRSMNGKIKNIEDLINIKGFPVEKANIISLYLEF
ncbi:ComEA family DNA-binding protein [Flavobacterium ajazii]|uniref:ComEA family DNA-binding protein n=1 Tax=Flavobacterium ajazii TaxID=2692318 RepID=UPI0013D716A6|nr:helix-hairpin-helix domain-containing protein [Flavobacterium ajazii]